MSKVKFHRWAIAILGSVLAYFIINVFIVPLKVWQYVAIEVLITMFHFLYNNVIVSINVSDE
jgi:hypothetical protein